MIKTTYGGGNKGMYKKSGPLPAFYWNIPGRGAQASVSGIKACPPHYESNTWEIHYNTHANNLRNNYVGFSSRIYSIILYMELYESQF